MKVKLPNHRWQIANPQAEMAKYLAQEINLLSAEPTSLLMTQVLINRSLTTTEDIQSFIDPELTNLPSPLKEFPDLVKSLDILEQAIDRQEKIAICGDYDADGMTSTALLIRALLDLNGIVDYAIPSRMKEGYGINQRIIEEFAQEGVSIILTVDNGIAAVSAVTRAIELGLKVIITDHHDLPLILPPADAILNPKLLPESSLYRSIAGVGVAYILAIMLAERLNKPSISNQLLELFTLGTIADLAPLTGINRRLVKQGLKLLPKSQIAGIQALIEVSGKQAKEESNDSLKPDDIGFKLGPRINAVGRINDPQIIIDLLTTNNKETALARAIQCEQINKQRQEMCTQIEEEAIAIVNQNLANIYKRRVLVIVGENWHHGVIGVVASRLVERYGLPVFIASYESAEYIRGSARSIPEFNVFHGLQYCDDLLDKYGGHKAAGGFSLKVENLQLFKDKLSEFAHQNLAIEHLKPLIEIDVKANLSDINQSLYQQINCLHPCGVENNEPIFYSENVRVLESKILQGKHLKLTLSKGNSQQPISAIGWRMGEYSNIPPYLDIAYKIKENYWQNRCQLQLEIMSLRLPDFTADMIKTLHHKNKIYTCHLSADLLRLKIIDDRQETLYVNKGQKIGWLKINNQEIKIIDVTEPNYFDLIKTAKQLLILNE